MDFFAFSGHKIYGPTGIGVLYGKKELLEKMPPYQSGSDMIEVVTMEGSTFQPLPLKFEAGTPMIAEVIGLGAAIRFVESIGLQSIAEWEHHLLEHATSKALTIPGLQLIGTSNKKGGILSFVVDGVHPLDIGTLLDVRGFAVRTGHLCAQPALRRLGISACVRASFAVYNTLEEVDAFIDALNEVLDLLR
jgi:cysteine desulfurase/selenocysteine lyase